MSLRTVARIRAQLGYKGHKGKKTIILMEKQKRARVRWCQQLKGDSLDNIIWTDEKPFELYKRRHLVYTKKGQQVRPRPAVKYSPKIQIWGGISCSGKSQLVLWKGRGNSADYIDTLECAALPFKQWVHSSSHRFLHDWDTTHTSGQTKAWLKTNKFEVLLLPAKSPDLNPIELVWNTLEEKVLAHNPTTETALRRCIVEEWNKLSLDSVNSSIDHVQSLIPQVIASGGEFMGKRRRH